MKYQKKYYKYKGGEVEKEYKTIRIAAISDIHEDKSILNELEVNKDLYDLILFAGDLTNLGDKIKTKFYMNKLNSIGKKVIFIPGNHDFYFLKHRDVEELKEKYKNIEILINEMTEYEGIKIYGCPMSLKFFNWAFMCSEKDMKKFLPNEYVDILLIHQPPLHSKLSEFYNYYSGNVNNPGSISLNEYIKDFKPKLVICGHIHENGGKSGNIEKTRCINVARKITYFEYYTH